jgi:phosphatidylinositol-4,5-bisphosphate 3-kinase
MGIKRERSLFVFTPQMAHVLGSVEGAAFRDFVQYCVTAYNTLRKHGNLLLLLFKLMIACGLPELQSEVELEWMRKALRLNMSDEAAGKEFTNIIYDCLKTRATQINDMFHMLKHA